MRRRWRLVLGLLLVTSCVAILAVPAIHWRLIGWARGEAFYLGRPTIYWRGEVVGLEEKVLVPEIVHLRIGGSKAIVHVCYGDWRLRESLWGKCLAGLGVGVGNSLPLPPIAKDEYEATPVLMELLQDADVKVRRFAVQGIYEVWDRAFLLAPEMRAALQQSVKQAMVDNDEFVRGYAEILQGRFGWLEGEEARSLEEWLEMKQAIETGH
jgi:hypothetical protein